MDASKLLDATRNGQGVDVFMGIDTGADHFIRLRMTHSLATQLTKDLGRLDDQVCTKCCMLAEFGSTAELHAQHDPDTDSTGPSISWCLFISKSDAKFWLQAIHIGKTIVTSAIHIKALVEAFDPDAAHKGPGTLTWFGGCLVMGVAGGNLVGAVATRLPEVAAREAAIQMNARICSAAATPLANDASAGRRKNKETL